MEKAVNDGVAIIVELEQSIAASREELRKVAHLVTDEDGRRKFEEGNASYEAAWRNGLVGMKKVLTDSYSDFVLYVVPQVCPPEKEAVPLSVLLIDHFEPKIPALN